ncbi:aromatic ring-hydroxylating dioxygenase subunit alpha [Paraburkholderia sp. CNPSo 3281]|uniref:aromatic ring-hydroxylating dioxygenase subunit alpha n=1 Tax=Paraburkholderia sp. CNPSo 3281 TaxID=2940933 RepID=UPI0020B70DEE|nr:aromatic ring-hydroxylating dioxygenase subunit alpha [Paraburkholderia sp. CNPSo 3281]MCP3720614.1 aromatic ring-hydroxylating dioxygenase subunit alpha [Paraburkholderia sp. CNPSo 3281]
MMTKPTEGVISVAQANAAKMADRNTSFVFDEWYVAALASEVGRSLLSRTLLGRRIVLYRTQAGTVVALDDRCIHRSYPLSAGTLENDTIVCGYHGFRYGAEGDLVEIPSQDRCPRGLGVHRYPVREIGPMIWIYMGEASAPRTEPPIEAVLNLSKWEYSEGYLPLRGNYVSLHENLLDLTHLSYIHAKSFGTPDYARAPFEVEIEEGCYALKRSVVPTTLPPVWAVPTGISSPSAARIATSTFVSPGLHVVEVTFYDSALPEEERTRFTIRTLHLPTPESHDSTHYFIVHCRDFALENQEITKFMHDQLFSAFREDVEALELLEGVLRCADADFFEISIASDRPSVEMRKYLKRRAGATLGT